MQVKQTKKVTRTGIDLAVGRMIRKTDKAPASFHKLKRVARDTATGLKIKGKKLNIPWGLLLVLIPGLIAIYLAISSMKKRKDGITPGLDEPINMKGRDEKGLLNDYGYKP